MDMLPSTYRTDDPSGVKHDTLVDARLEVDGAKFALNEIYVMLDAIADDSEGIWTDDERSQLRAMQKDAEALADECDKNLTDIKEELDTLR